MYERRASWVIGDRVVHPLGAYEKKEEWLEDVRKKFPEWEGAFKVRDKELKHGVKWKKLTNALVEKIFNRLTELEKQ